MALVPPNMWYDNAGWLHSGTPPAVTYSGSTNTVPPPATLYDADLMMRVQPRWVQQKEDCPMRHLYEVFVVEVATGLIQYEAKTVCENEATARLAAGLGAGLQPEDIEAYDMVVRAIGPVRAAPTPPTQVTLVKDKK